MPRQAPQAEQALLNSSIALIGDGAPSRGFMALSPATARRTFTPHRATSNCVCRPVARIDASASLAAAASARSVGKGRTIAASDMGPNCRVSCATFGRTSVNVWTCRAASNIRGTSYTKATCNPRLLNPQCISGSGIGTRQASFEVMSWQASSRTIAYAAESAGLFSASAFSVIAVAALSKHPAKWSRFSGVVIPRNSNSAACRIAPSQMAVAAEISGSVMGAQYGAAWVQCESPKGAGGTALNPDRAGVAVNVLRSGHDISYQFQAAPPPGGLGLGRAVETRASLARTGAATALYRSSRPHYPVPQFSNSGHPSAAETPTQMASQAVGDKRANKAAHASEARELSYRSAAPSALLARWAALGCDQTSRHSFATMGAGAFTLQRPSSSCVETRQHQPVGLVSVGPRQFGQVLPVFSCNRKRSEFAPSRQNNTPDRFAKESVGGFHRLSSSSAPCVEAFV